jgi:alpha-glucosidase
MKLASWLARAFEVALAPFALLGVAHAQGVGERLGDGIACFWPDSAARDQAVRAPALFPFLPAPGAAWVPVAESGVRPVFQVRGGGRIVRVEVPRGTTLYGTGEVPGSLVRNGAVSVCWNTDAYGYDANSPSLYQSHPWVLAVRPDGSSFGVIAATPGRVTIDLTHGIEFRAQGPVFPVVVIDRPSPQDVVRSLGDLTGKMPLPPRWALGFQQCRYSYAPDSEVVRIAREFRARGLPCDVLWLDIDYMDRRKPFTFDPRGFPHPESLSDTLHSRGFRSVWILDPGIKQEPGDFMYESGLRGEHWVTMPDGTPFTGRVWPGECNFPDFTREATRAWWSASVASFAARAGADGIWNDMNEPAVFDAAGKSMPETAWHRADGDLGGPGYHARYHNLYGMLMARASWEGMKARAPERRPFVLSRANFLGGQRWAAAWTGDNRSNAAHLAMALPMVLNLGLSGQPFAGPDIGGYAGPVPGEDFAAWMGLGALLPFSRAHTETGNARKEPWSFGPQVEALCRRALQTRYRLLPYLYTVFEEASRTGLPVARPAFFADPTAEWLRAVEHEFLLGADLLVDLRFRPEWKDAKRLSGDAAAWRPATVIPGEPSDALPGLFVRAGAIVPLGPLVNFSDERPLEEVELLVAPDAAGRAEGWLYEDAGDGSGYTRGEFRRTHLVAETHGHTVRVRAETAEGGWTAPGARRWRVTLLGGAKGATVEAPRIR